MNTTQDPGVIIDMGAPIATPPAARPTTALATATPGDLLRIALESGADLDRLERLMKMQQEWEAQQARKAYVAAIATFKKNPPKILKDKRVLFTSAKGTTDYMHATLGGVTQPIIEGLAAVGISHRWDVLQPDGGMIQVTCILTHEAGHSESVTMRAGRDDTGGKNNIQQVASTITYLERYTLLSITGLATHDMPDDDGAGSEPAEKPATRTDKIAQSINKPITLDHVLAAYNAATSADEIKAADGMAAKLGNEADKEIAKSARKGRIADLSATQKAWPFMERMKAAATQEERDTIMSESATLPDDARAKVEAVWLELKVTP